MYCHRDFFFLGGGVTHPHPPHSPRQRTMLISKRGKKMEEKRKRRDKGKKKEFVDKKGNGRQNSEMGRKKEWFRNKDFGRSFSNWAWEGWSLEQYTPLLLLTCASFPSSPPRNESCTPRSLGHRKTRNIYFYRFKIVFGGKSIKHISCCKWHC